MLELRPMTAVEFEEYLGPAVKSYADEKVKAGNWSIEEAPQSSEKEFLGLLPKGVATKNQHLFSLKVADTGENVGMIWFAVGEQAEQPVAFICDFSVRKAFRGRGYGEAALRELEHKVRGLGLSTISLHVFSHNHTARSLYEKLGYKVTTAGATNVNMTKQLAG